MIEALVRAESKYLPLSRVTVIKVTGLCDGGKWTLTEELQSANKHSVYYAKYYMIWQLVKRITEEVKPIDRLSITSFN